MEITKQPTFVLIISDSNFINICQNPTESIARLKENMLKTRDLCLFTVSGRYGLTNIDEEIAVTEVVDKNKTSFSQTLENASIMFEEIVVLSNSPNDPYLVAAREVATNNNKTFTIYKYHSKV